LKRFFTAPKIRGKGVGKMLLRSIAKFARELKYDEMRLDTSANLVAAIKVYENVGFEQYARDCDSLRPEIIFYKLDLR